MKKTFFSKFLSALLSFTLLWQSFVPVVVLAQELEASSSAEIELTEPSPTPEPSLTPSPEPEPSPELVILPDVVATQSADPVQSATPVLTWLALDDHTDVTAEPVVVGKTYQFRNTKVSLTFSRVDQSGFLTIKEISLNDEQVEELSALSKTAYEITSTMPDGSFAYDLTLPLPPTSEPVVAKLAENVNDLDSDSQSVGLVEQTNDTVTLSNLDHFTVFVLVNDANTGNADATDDVANADVVGIDDSWIEEDSGNSNHNGSALLVKSRSGQDRRSLVKFSSISASAGSTIDQATLRLWLDDAPSGAAGSRTYNLHRLTADWDETTVTWNNQPAHEGAVSASVVTGTSNDIWLEWDVTADVQNFLDGSYNNFGWKIIDASEDDSSSPYAEGNLRRSEHSNEHTRPQLVLDFVESASQPTEYNSPTTHAATADGDGNGFEVNPTGVFTDGGGYASNINGAGDKHIFYDYNFSLPAGATINGIEVRVDWWLDGAGDNNSLSVQLSADGGGAWTDAKSDITETLQEHIASLGDDTDTWGRVWTDDEFSNDNFRVRVNSISGSTSRDFYLDWIPVRVYYTPAVAPDTTEPSTIFDTSPDSITNDNTLSYTGTSTDDSSGIALVEYKVVNDDTLATITDWTPATASDGAFDGELTETFEFTTVTLVDGNYTVSARATDVATNVESTATHSVLIDTVAPYLDSQTSFSGWYTSSQTSTFTYADDLSGIVSGTPVTCDITIDGLAQTCSVTPNVCDAAGNCNTDEVTSNSADIDSTLPDDPTPNSTSHALSTWDNDRTIDVTWSGASDATSGVDGFYTEWNTSATTITGPLVKEYEETDDSETSPQLASGQDHYFHIATVDLAGNWTGTAHLGPFWIDAVNPSVSWVTPLNGAVLSGSVPLEATASDADSGIQRVRFRYRPGTSGSFTTIDTDLSDPFEASWDTTSLVDGEYQLRAVARDNSTRTRQSTITVTVDNTIPSTTFTSVPDDISLTDILDYEGTSTDALTGVDLVEYRILDSVLAEVLGWTTATPVDGDFDGETSEDFTFTTPSLSDGEYTVEARATDTAGNIESTATDTVMIDTTDPTDPTDVASTSHTVSVVSSTNIITMAWTIAGTAPGATDATSGVDGYSVEFSQDLNTTPDDTKDLEETDTGIVSTALVNGTWYFHLRTVDNAGYWTATVHAGPYLIGTTTSGTTTGTVAGASTASPAVCSATKPAGTPTLLSAAAGLNSVTLTWSEGAGPLDYYLVAFGLAPGSIAFGNPNIGGAGTTSYTVSGLSGGTTYYFQVRSGNDCAPGDYSNELSATPGGGFIGGLPAGFAEGVLGEATESAQLEQATALTLPTAEDLSKVLGTDVSDWSSWWWLWLLIVILLLLGWYYLKKKKK